MAKTKISEYDSTAANNTDIDSINIAEGMAPSNVNNAIRELMAHLKDMNIGSTITMLNTTEEDGDGGRVNKIIFKGEQSGGEESVLGEIQFSHDGSSDDQKGDLIFKTNDGSDGTSPTERLRIDSAGATTFTVSDQGSAFVPNTSSTWNALEIFQDRGVTNSASGIAFRSQSGTAPAGIVSVAGNTTGGVESLAFMTSTGNTTSEAMRIDSSAKLRVGGDSATMSNSLTVEGEGYQLFGMKRNTGVTTGTGEFAMHMETNSQTTVSYDDEGSIVFGTAGTPTTAAGFSEKMRLNSSGQLLVNTTNVNVRSSNDDEGMVYRAGLSLDISAHSDTVLNVNRMSSNGTCTEFRRGGNVVGGVSVTPSSTSFNTSSDYRLKENVTDISDGITRVKQLAPKRFNFIADADTTVDGFLAHEAATVVPEAVTGTKDGMMDEEYEATAAKGDVYTPATDDADEVVHSSNVEQPETLEEGQEWRETAEAVMGTRTVPDMQGIDQAKIVPLLTAALKEAIAKIEALETRVATLEG